MSKKSNALAGQPVRRNLHACAAIMRKGGVHESTTKAKRNQAKRQLNKAMREGGNSSPFYCQWNSIFPESCA